LTDTLYDGFSEAYECGIKERTESTERSMLLWSKVPTPRISLIISIHTLQFYVVMYLLWFCELGKGDLCVWPWQIY